jgi:hypothetical protein
MLVELKLQKLQEKSGRLKQNTIQEEEEIHFRLKGN